MNWTFCCIPLESSSTFLCVHSASLQALAPLQRTHARLALGQMMQPAQKHEMIQHLHPLVQPALFGHVADAAQLFAVKRFAKQPAPGRRPAW